MREIEVIVVDNASQDESLVAAKAKPWVRVIRNTKNMGFAAGQNLGIRIARSKYVMPLNFDIYLMPDFLSQAVAALDRYPQVGTVSGKMLRMQSNGERTNEIDNAGLLLTRRRMIHHRGRGEQDYGQYQQRDLVFGAMGAAAIFRHEMLEDIAYKGQYFDESFFTWYEDVDLDWRARLKGWECLYVPEAVVYHVGDPQGHGRSKFGAENGIRNRWKMILANDCRHCLAKDIVPLLAEELALLRHVVRHGLIGAYFRALKSLLFSLPDTLEKRRWVRGRAVRTCLPSYPFPIGEG